MSLRKYQAPCDSIPMVNSDIESELKIHYHDLSISADNLITLCHSGIADFVMLLNQ